MRDSNRSKRIILVTGVLVLAAVGFGYTLMRAQSLPEGPQAIVWDKEACSHCRMHVSDPAFASQLQTTDGQVLNFDDPGCLVHYIVDHAPSLHAMWFHHSKADRWLNVAQVGFVPASSTPMDYGYGAVDRATPGALSFQQFTEALLKGHAQAGAAATATARNTGGTVEKEQGL